MNSSLPTDIQQRINAQLASGVFASQEDVLREALTTLERRQLGLQKLQAMVDEAEADVVANRLGHFDRDDIKRDIRQWMAKQGIID